METAEGSVPDSPSAAGISYLLYAAALGSFYFVPFIGTLSMSDLSWTAFAAAARRHLIEPTALVFLTPFIVAALAWGLGARRGLRPGFSALCRELTWFLVAQAAAFAFMASWGRGYTRHPLVAAWVFACLAQVFVTAKRCARVLTGSFGLQRPLAFFGLFALAFSLFEYVLFVGEWRGALLRTALVVGADVDFTISLPLPASVPIAPGDDAAPEYRRARTLFKPLTFEQSERAWSVVRGGWKDPHGEWAARLEQNGAALAAFRAAARRPECDFSVPGKKVERYPEVGQDLSHLVHLSQLALLDARRAEAQGRAAAAADDYVAVLRTGKHLLRQKKTKDAAYFTLVEWLLMRRAWPPLSQYLAQDLGSAADDAKLLDALLRLDAARPPFGQSTAADERLWLDFERKRLENAPRVLRAGLREKALEDYDAEALRAYDAFAAGARDDPAVYARYLDDLKARTAWMFPDSAAAANGQPDRCVYHPGRLGKCWAARGAMWLQEMVRNGIHERVGAADERVLATAAALRLREKNGHRAPAALAMLAPEIPRPFRDPFADAPLRYAVDGLGRWTVYSVGPDRKDDKAESLFVADFVQDWRDPPRGDIALSGSP